MPGWLPPWALFSPHLPREPCNSISRSSPPPPPAPAPQRSPSQPSPLGVPFPDPSGQRLPGRTLGSCGQGRRLRLLPPRTCPSRGSRPAAVPEAPGSSRQLSRAACGGRGCLGKERRAAEDRGQGETVGAHPATACAGAAPPLIGSIGAPRPGARRGGGASLGDRRRGRFGLLSAAGRERAYSKTTGCSELK